MTATLRDQATTATEVMYMALELSGSKWRAAFATPGDERTPQWSIAAGDLAALARTVERAKAKLGGAAGTVVRSVYEAGRDGFWLHRWLQAQGVDNRVIDAGSIEVNTARKRRKTDRLDARLLLRKLIAFWGGDRRVFSVVEVPPQEVEAVRRLERERERLVGESTGHTNRIRSLLALEGHARVAVDRHLRERLAELRRWDGTALPRCLIEEIEREFARLEQVREQRRSVEAEQQRLVEAGDEEVMQVVRTLERVKGVGPGSAWILSLEMLGWRRFANRKQVAALAGLAPTPHASGSSEREQGIDKHGNRRVRAVMVELAWRWLRWQPHSELSQWFRRRYGGASRRQRRIGIVALARRLLVALWRYVARGELDPDVVLSAG
ncbi:IS110 family transposase [Halofilum ochraceum]|uniref:IS110 family transposase n=1 Tax=Halofilum ochraceum TaxID=1611323 RepID=UPI0008DA0950|nr:IS110 family transposase [Halofilum ochraceum]